MRPIQVTVGPLTAAASNDSVCRAQTPTGVFILNGDDVADGIARFDSPRRFSITVAANEIDNIFIVTGTGYNGAPLTEIMPGFAPRTVNSELDFLTINKITLRSPARGIISVGRAAVASSPWARMDPYFRGQVFAQCIAEGDVNYNIQTTNQDPDDGAYPIPAYDITWEMVGNDQTTSTVMNFASVPNFMKIHLNSGTGTVKMIVNQV